MGLDCNAHASGDASAHLCIFNDLAGAILSLLGARRPRVLRAGTGDSPDRFSGNVTLIYKSPIGSAKRRIFKLQTRQPKNLIHDHLPKSRKPVAAIGYSSTFNIHQNSTKQAIRISPFLRKPPLIAALALQLICRKTQAATHQASTPESNQKKDQFNGNSQGTSRPTGRTGKTD